MVNARAGQEWLCRINCLGGALWYRHKYSKNLESGELFDVNRSEHKFNLPVCMC